MARADARRNRERILAVAEEVFGAGGQAAPTEEIARRAGVGIGTVFRHFPTKTDLLEAVFLAHLDRLRDSARHLRDSGEPATAFFDYFTQAVQDATAKLTLAGALTGAGVDLHGIAGTAAREVREAMGDLLAAAQGHGAVRRDVTVQDVYGLLVGISQAAHLAGLDREVVDRMVAVVLDGLRAG